MMDLSLNLDGLAEWWTMVLLHSLWLATLIYIGLVVLLSSLRIRSASVRYNLAMLALLAVPCLSILAANNNVYTSLTQTISSIRERTSNSNASVSAELNQRGSGSVATDNTSNLPLGRAPFRIEEAAKVPAVASPDVFFHVSRLVGAIWLIGASCMLLRLGRSHYLVQRIITAAVDPIPDELQASFQKLSQRTLPWQKATLRLSGSVLGPMVYGVIYPVVLLPTSMITGISPDSIRAILAHELAHIRRWDLVLGYVDRLIEAFFFYHPAIWRMLRLVRREREVACDEFAAATIGHRLKVATALVDAMETLVKPTPKVGMAAGDGCLEERVERLVDPQARSSTGLIGANLLASIFYGVVGLTLLTAGTTAVAVQVKETLSPQQQQEAVETAIAATAKTVFDFDKEKTRIIRGRFVGPNGDPLPKENATATLSIQQSRSGTSAGISIKSDGQFSYKTQGGPGTVHAMASVKGHGYSLFGPFQLAGNDLDLGDLQLDSGFTAQLKFVDAENGKGVSDVVVRQFWLNIPHGSTGINRYVGSSSNEDGSLSLPHAGNGKVRIAVEKSGYEFAQKELALQPNNPIRWELVRSKKTIGRLVDQAGQGIAGVEIHGVRSTGRISLYSDPMSGFIGDVRYKPTKREPMAVTDKDGKFELTTLAGDTTYYLLALSENTQPQVIDNVKLGMELGDVKLSPPLLLKGRFVGDLGKLSVRRKSNQRYLQYQNRISFRKLGNQTVSALGSTRTTPVGDDGSFSLPQLVPGLVRITAGGEMISFDLKESNENYQIDLNNPQAPKPVDRREVKVKFKSTDGREVKGEIQLYCQQGELKERVDGPTYKDIVLKNNAAQWSVPVGVKLWLNIKTLIGTRAKSRSLGVIEPGTEPLEFEVEVEPAGLLTGQVLDADGKPVTRFRLSVDRMEGKNRHFDIDEQIEHPEGRFSVGPLSFDRNILYQAYVFPKETFETGWSEKFSVDAAEPVYQTTINMPKSYELHGVVLNEDEQPVGEVGVAMVWNFATVSRGLGSSTKTNSKGEFKLRASGPPTEGNMKLQFRPVAGNTGLSLKFTPDEYFPKGDLGKLRVGPGSQISGRVVDADGNPVPHVRMGLMPNDWKVAKYESGHNATCDAEGNFVFHGVEHIPQRLTIYGAELVGADDPFYIDPQGNDLSRWLVNPNGDVQDVEIVVRKN